METYNLELTDEQKCFLAVLYAFGKPVSAEVAGILAPLLPGPLFDLIDKGRSSGWLRQERGDRFSLTADLPEPLNQWLADLTGPEALNQMINRIYENQLAEKLGPEKILGLLKKAGRAN